MQRNLLQIYSYLSLWYIHIQIKLDLSVNAPNDFYNKWNSSFFICDTSYLVHLRLPSLRLSLLVDLITEHIEDTFEKTFIKNPFSLSQIEIWDNNQEY